MAKAKGKTTSVAAGIPTKYLYNGILISLAGILFGSLNHLAVTFNSVEAQDASGIVPWIISIGIESGMMVIAFGVSLRRRRKEKAGFLMAGLSFFAFINFFSNIYYSFSTYTHIRNLKWSDVQDVDSLVVITILVLSGSLPVLIMMLAELQSLFFVQLKSEEFSLKIAEEKERKKLEKSERLAAKRPRSSSKKIDETEPTALATNSDEEQEEEIEEEAEEEVEEEDSVAVSPLNDIEDVPAAPVEKKNGTRRRPVRRNK